MAAISGVIAEKSHVKFNRPPRYTPFDGAWRERERRRHDSSILPRSSGGSREQGEMSTGLSSAYNGRHFAQPILSAITSTTGKKTYPSHTAPNVDMSWGDGEWG